MLRFHRFFFTISNAVKYNKDEGEVRLIAKIIGDELSIEVSDSGSGIPNEYIPNLFQKFYRVPGSEQIATGTGLGLAICKQIIDAHRGRIDVKSKINIGTSFTVYLPLKPTV